MRSAFLIIRFIFFSAMVYMNILSIIFAAWNIGEVRAAGISAPGASVFMIMNGIVTFAFVAAALAELVSPTSRSANVTFECGWTAVFSVLHLGAAVAATVNGPPSMCQPNAPWGVCASSYTLVPVSWLCAFIAITYFLMLIGTAVAHMHAYPIIWWKTIYTVPWFIPPASDPAQSTVPTNIESKTREYSPENRVPFDAASRRSHDSFMVVRYLRGRMPTKGSDVEGQMIEEPILFPTQSNGLIPPVPTLPSTPTAGLSVDAARMSPVSSSPQPMWAKQAMSVSRRGRDAPFTLANNNIEDEDAVAESEEEVASEVRPPSPPLQPLTITITSPSPPRKMASFDPSDDSGYEEPRAAVAPPPIPPPTPLVVAVARETSRRGRHAPTASIPMDAVEYSPASHSPMEDTLRSFPRPPPPPKAARINIEVEQHDDDGFFTRDRMSYTHSRRASSMRRGVDRPFSRGPPPPAPATAPQSTPMMAPKYIQKRDLHMPPRVPQFDTRPLAPARVRARSGSVPAAVGVGLDENAPIPLGKRSDWVRADVSQVSGRDVAGQRRSRYR